MTWPTSKKHIIVSTPLVLHTIKIVWLEWTITLSHWGSWMKAHRTLDPVCNRGCPATLEIVNHRDVRWHTFEGISLSPPFYARWRRPRIDWWRLCREAVESTLARIRSQGYRENARNHCIDDELKKIWVWTRGYSSSTCQYSILKLEREQEYSADNLIVGIHFPSNSYHSS